MKIKLSLDGLLITLLVSCVSVSCSKSPQDGAAVSDQESVFSLADVKRSFESDYACLPPTRADEAFDEDNVLSPGWITPAWDSVSLYSNDNLSQAVTAFSARYEYRLLRWDEDGRPELSPMPSRLVVLKNSETDRTASYLRFFIPDADYSASDSGADFSGLVLYTTLSGYPVSVGKFSGGILADSASLVNASANWEERADKMAAVLGNVVVARVRPMAATRKNDNIIYSGGGINAVEIAGKAPVIILRNRPFTDQIIPIGAPPMNDIDLGGGGGSGGDGDGGMGNAPEPPFAPNPKITIDDEQVKNILNSLYNDCMGQLLINAIKTKVTITSGFIGGSSVGVYIYNFPEGPVVDHYEVKIGSRRDAIPVMEELMHIYQGIGTADFRGAALNNEIEAKLAWVMYLSRIGSKINTASMLGGQDGVKYFNIMSKSFLQNDLNNLEFTEAFENAAGALRTMKDYKDEKRYPFDPGKMEMKKLQELMRDCVKNKN